MLNPQLKDGLPHWEVDFDPELWPVFEDFRNFLYVLWQHLGLPDPTAAQYEIAHRLQYGYDTHEAVSIDASELEALYRDPREDIVRCFRGLGKSYVTVAYVIWRLMRNPRDEKILVVSASGSKAKEFVAQCKGILESMTLAQWLLAGPRESGATRRDQADQFDVAGGSLSQSYSVAARGITGQITGSRATLLIADDIEVPGNSATEDARQKLLRTIESDFVPITKTEHGKGDIILLGTPQTEESIYNVLVKDKGFRCFCIPVKYPAAEKLQSYILTTTDGHQADILAPYLRALHEAGKLPAGAPTDLRFGMDELIKVEAKGRSSFALQYMLDTALSDAERYPLKQHDLILFALNPLKAPLTAQWGRHNDRKNSVSDMPNLGFTGDHFLRPLFVDAEWAPYEHLMVYVDPAGRGKDETAWAVLGCLNGLIYLLHLDGHAGDPAEAMQRIAADVKRFKPNVLEVEPNFGQGMWVEAFKPVLKAVAPEAVCGIKESEWAKGQKETRIIDTLEPVMTQHRLVVDEGVARREAAVSGERVSYSFLYQLTHITRDRGSLKHDDRLDAVAGGVAAMLRSVGVDKVEAAQAVRDQWIDEELEDYWAAAEIGSSTMMRRSSRRQRGEERPVVYLGSVG